VSGIAETHPGLGVGLGPPMELAAGLADDLEHPAATPEIDAVSRAKDEVGGSGAGGPEMSRDDGEGCGACGPPARVVFQKHGEPPGGVAPR